MADDAGWDFRGIIEGFYGPPWSWADRADLMRWCHERGMTHYLYAPKDDPLHRERWRELYPSSVVDEFARLVAQDSLRVGFAISPGLSIDYAAADDRAALAAKVDQLVGIGVDLICLAVDDIDVRPGLGDDHATLTTWLHDHLAGRASLVLVPTEYTGTAPSPYLDALAAGVPDDVPIGWTGATVVCDRITAPEARARADALGGRRPFVWDNYPVNDAIMGDRLFLGPLRGRDDDLASACSGYASNPMVQPQASKPALASIASYLRGDSPESGWSAAVDLLGVRVLAEACDGARPHELVDAVVATSDDPGWAGPLAELVQWLRVAAEVEGSAFGSEADAWVTQTRREAEVGLVAARVLQAVRPVGRVDGAGDGKVARPDTRGAVEQAMALTYLWPIARRGQVSVMGPRCSFRPVLSQWPDGEWRFHAASLTEDRNAIDALVRHALTLLDASRDPRELELAGPGGEPVEVAADGTFHAPPGSCTVTCAGLATDVVAAVPLPLKDRRLDP